MPDRFTIRVVVVGLAVTVILAVTGGIILALRSVNVPDFVIGVGMTALGALAGVLAKTTPDTPVVSAEHAQVDVQSE